MELQTKPAYETNGSSGNLVWDYNVKFDKYAENTMVIDSVLGVTTSGSAIQTTINHVIRYRSTTYPISCLKKTYAAIKVKRINQALSGDAGAADSVFVKVLIRITKNIGTKKEPIYKQIIYTARYLSKLVPRPIGMPDFTDPVATELTTFNDKGRDFGKISVVLCIE